MNYYAGIDLGGTNTRVALIDDNNKVVCTRKAKTDPSKDPEKVARTTGNLIKEVYKTTGGRGEIKGICIGFAGLLSPDGREVRIGPNFGWRDVPFADLIEREIDHPIMIVNDLTAVSYGEFSLGAGRGSRNMFCVYVGSGIGSALIIDRRPYEGSSNVAGELGHIKIREKGLLCGCGARGCLEAYTGGNSVRERLIRLAREDKKGFLFKSVNGRLEKLNYSYVEKGYIKKDAVCTSIFFEIKDLLSMAIANVVTVFNPDCVVIGGGAISHTPRLLNAVIKDIKRYATPPSASILKVKKAVLGDDAGMIGAALLIKEKLKLT